jgi:hypothetical protein
LTEAANAEREQIQRNEEAASAEFERIDREAEEEECTKREADSRDGRYIF